MGNVDNPDLIGKAETLNDFCKIAKIESVMRLRRRREKLGAAFIVQAQRCVNGWIQHLENLKKENAHIFYGFYDIRPPYLEPSDHKKEIRFSKTSAQKI